MALRTLIVEDEPLSVHYLDSLLSGLPAVEVVARAATEEAAIAAIQSLQPDLVFLDIELHSGTGFEVLRKTQQRPYAVVFTTALEELAIRMIQLSGVPFLQKPIDAEEVAAMVASLPRRQAEERKALGYLLHMLDHDGVPRHICLQPEAAPRQYIELEEVLYLASGSPTSFLLRDGTVRTDRRSLKELGNLLEDFHFFRSAASHLVNLKHLIGVAPAGDALRLTDGSAVPLSPKRSEALSARLAGL